MADSPRRVFYALWPEGQALALLDRLAEAGVAQCGGRRMRRDTLHLTLTFIGAVTPSQLGILKSVGRSVRAVPFDLRLDRMGYWPHNQILWAGCSHPPSSQRRLFDDLSLRLQEAGMPVEGAAWHPHVTLVRKARGGNLPALGEPINWPVRDFVLVESFLQASGARYRILDRWMLQENA